MKGFNCPNCGKRQPIKLDAPSRVALVCIECGKSLLVKMDKGKWSVAIPSRTSGTPFSSLRRKSLTMLISTILLITY